MTGNLQETALPAPADPRGIPQAANHVIPLQAAAFGLARAKRQGPGVKTRDLVGFLLGHGARAWRASMPATRTHVCARTPDGRLAVRLKLG